MYGNLTIKNGILKINQSSKYSSLNVTNNWLNATVPGKSQSFKRANKNLDKVCDSYYSNSISNSTVEIGRICVGWKNSSDTTSQRTFIEFWAHGSGQSLSKVFYNNDANIYSSANFVLSTSGGFYNDANNIWFGSEDSTVNSIDWNNNDVRRTRNFTWVSDTSSSPGPTTIRMVLYDKGPLSINYKKQIRLNPIIANHTVFINGTTFINSSLRLGARKNITCSIHTEGTYFYNYTTHRMNYCNSTAWRIV
jgi:hypothetical protein